MKKLPIGLKIEIYSENTGSVLRRPRTWGGLVKAVELLERGVNWRAERNGQEASIEALPLVEDAIAEMKA